MNRSSIIATCASIAILLTLALLLFHRMTDHGRQASDVAHLHTIYGALAGGGGGQREHLPRPGLIDRLRDPYTGSEVAGVGPEDITANTTANVYSLLIITGQLAPETLVSPRERNPVVVADSDYDFTAWQPAQDRYWDRGFVADLRSGSNVSYGHIPQYGQAARVNWHEVNPAQPIVGSRGPGDGIASPRSLSCAADGDYIGHFVASDGSISSLEAEAGSRIASPNPFDYSAEEERGLVPVIAFTTAITEDGAVLQHD